MPCFYTGTAEGDAALIARESNERMIKRLTETTRAACEMAAKLKRLGRDDELSPETRRWIRYHAKRDSKNKP